MQPLKVKARCVLDAEGRIEHIKSALARGLEEFGPSKEHDKEICIIGSGPSVRTQVKKIRNLKKKGCFILAVKGAHDFLLKNKIMPHAAVAVDPQPHIVRCFRRKLPPGEITRPAYLIASQCCPEVFDYLEDQRVILWHLLSNTSQEVLKNKIQLGGGSTSGSRAMVLGWMMGFRAFHLFGFDSCLQGQGESKLRKITGERWGGLNDSGKREVMMELVCEGETFFADPAMAAQANEIQDVVKMLTGSMFKAYGKGLIQTIFKANRDKEWGGYYAVGDEFGSHRVPPVRKKDADNIKKEHVAAREGIYRGCNYFPERGDKAA
jgi:hypothetical protein